MTIRTGRPRGLRPLIPGMLAVVVAWPLSSAAAQSLVSTTSDDVTLGIQLKNPALAMDDAPSRWSSSLEADLLFRWGANTFVQATVPIAFAGAEFVDGTSFYLGAIGATFIFGPPGSPASFLGFTLPTATNVAGPDLAILIAVLPNEEEPELWAEDIMSVRGGIMPSMQLSERTRVGLRIGGALLAPNDVESLWAYGRGAVWGNAMLGAAEVRGDLVTSYFINSDAGFAEQFRMYLDARAGLPEVPGRPGVFLRFPIDTEARDALDFSVGLSARIGL